MITAFETNVITTFNTNKITTFETNKFATFGTNMITAFETNKIISFKKNQITTSDKNVITTFETNIITTSETNMFTAFEMNMIKTNHDIDLETAMSMTFGTNTYFFFSSAFKLRFCQSLGYFYLRPGIVWFSDPKYGGGQICSLPPLLQSTRPNRVILR